MRTAVPPRVAPPPFGTGATLTAAVTGLPRAVLVRAWTRFFRELPGDGRIGADAPSLREPGSVRCGGSVSVECPRHAARRAAGAACCGHSRCSRVPSLVECPRHAARRARARRVSDTQPSAGPNSAECPQHPEARPGSPGCCGHSGALRARTSLSVHDTPLAGRGRGVSWTLDLPPALPLLSAQKTRTRGRAGPGVVDTQTRRRGAHATRGSRAGRAQTRRGQQFASERMPRRGEDA